MSYHPLSNDTGGDADSRRAEANRILEILDREPQDHFTQRQQEFIEQMSDRLRPVSAKQLFWLRDLKDSL
jgi:hypothetical protein